MEEVPAVPGQVVFMVVDAAREFHAAMEAAREQGATDKQLADWLGVSQATLARIEKAGLH